jgi:formylglycine-generating enzyme required for sulfatase activity
MLDSVTCRLRSLPPGTSAAEEHQRVLDLLQRGVPPCVPEMVNSIGMRFALIPPGRFLMGSPETAARRAENEKPQHEVTISKPFYLAVYPVTQKQWWAVMGNNPSCFCATGGGKDMVEGLNTDDFPVEEVSWKEAAALLKKLAALPEEVKKVRHSRLPTEAEWEYACRGGLPFSIFHSGNSLSSTQANVNDNFPHGNAAKGAHLARTCQVGCYPPNANGLYDLHGNVWEWCQDWYDGEYDASSPQHDPAGPTKGPSRVLRGRSWNCKGSGCAASSRFSYQPGDRSSPLGFRLLAVSSE